jgi:uncharacterized protein YcbX
MRGEALPAATLTLQGVPEDRRYAFVQAESRSSFPWLTARELPELLSYKPAVEPAGSGKVAVTVTTPGGDYARPRERETEPQRSTLCCPAAREERGCLCDGFDGRRRSLR